LYNLKCPPTVQQTNNLQIDIYRMGSVITSYQCCKVSSILPGLKSATVSFEDNRMAQVTNYNFDLIIN